MCSSDLEDEYEEEESDEDPDATPVVTEKDPTEANDEPDNEAAAENPEATAGPKKGRRARPQVKIPEACIDKAKRALAEGRNMPKGASRQELLAYRWLLNKERKRLIKLRKELDVTQVINGVAKDIERVNAEAKQS